MGIILKDKVAIPDINKRRKELDNHQVVSNGLLPRTYYKDYKEDSVVWLSNILKTYLLIPKNNGTIFWAHNGGRFDFLFILKSIVALGYTDSDFTIMKKENTYLSIRVYFYPLKRKNKILNRI